MREAKIGELKTHLSRYLSLVRKGETIRVLDRDRPIAQIVPIEEEIGGRAAGAEVLATLERKGMIRRGTGKIDPEILKGDPPGRSAGVLQALLDERDGR